MQYRGNVHLRPKSDESKKTWSSSTCLLYATFYSYVTKQDLARRGGGEAISHCLKLLRITAQRKTTVDQDEVDKYVYFIARTIPITACFQILRH